jgi:hypothetical protein
MRDKSDDSIDEMHERLLKESMQQIDDSINHLNDPISTGNVEIPEPDSLPRAPQQKATQPPNGRSTTPDKVNEIRNQVAVTQPLMSKDKQSKLMNIAEQKSEQFKKELQEKESLDKEAIERAAQKFQNQLLEYIRHELIQKKYVVGT